MIDLYKKRSLGTFCSEVLLLVISAFIYSIAFPGFVSEKGLGFIAFFAIIPVLIVIKNTSWKAVGFHGFLFGVAFYCFFNYFTRIIKFFFFSFIKTYINYFLYSFLSNYCWFSNKNTFFIIVNRYCNNSIFIT